MRGAGTKLVAGLLIVLMAVGSIAMWLVVPFGWIWVVSRQVQSSQPRMGPYVLLLFAIPLSMVAIGKLLGRLNRIYGEVTGTAPEVRVRAAVASIDARRARLEPPARRARRRHRAQRERRARPLRAVVLPVRGLEPPT